MVRGVISTTHDVVMEIAEFPSVVPFRASVKSTDEGDAETVTVCAWAFAVARRQSSAKA